MNTPEPEEPTQDQIAQAYAEAAGVLPIVDLDSDLGELDPSAACKLGDETCESCQ